MGVGHFLLEWSSWLLKWVLIYWCTNRGLLPNYSGITHVLHYCHNRLADGLEHELARVYMVCFIATQVV